MSKPSIPIVSVSTSELDEFLQAQPDHTRAWLSSQNFKGKSGSLCLVPGDDGGLARVVCGVGDSRGIWSAGHVAAKIPKGSYHLDADWDDPPTALMALGFLLDCYRFNRYRSKPAEAPTLELPESHRHELSALADAVGLCRDLVNTPTENLGPPELGQAVAALGEEFGAEVSEIVGDDLIEQSFPAVHAVGRASAQAPRLISLQWGSESDPCIALVGKGVCFDSGGLNIKPANGMRLMKKDMGGAAHAMGVARLVMASGLPVRLLLLVPAVENAISGNAYRPGDVIPTRKGKSVEIGNTDAEGRVILSDALTYAEEQHPELIVDFATLTGAARVAMGTDIPPFWSTCDTLARDLAAASDSAEDPLWRLPLHPPYRDLLKSDIADINNMASTGFGGAITAALFLREFVDDTPWCHIDTFAWNTSRRPGRPKGGDALGLRAVFEMLRVRYGGGG
ncbi:MAG: leucyl aminopeptidase family protein [Xanthomonadales bacterium]|nr:leucyl aminopeptidase family protein [Xanthomonadales bacterium]